MIFRYRSSTGRTRLFLALSHVVSRPRFLEAAKVRPGSYGERMANRLFEQMLSQSLDLKRDFTLYYRVEYGDFFKYCRRRRGLPPIEARRLSEAYDKSAAILEYRGGHYLFAEEEGMKILNTLLASAEEQ